MISCENCNGACCRWVMLGKIPPQEARGVAEWAHARGAKVLNGVLFLPHRCPMLAQFGGCAIYPTRPAPCKNMKVGGVVCLACRELEGIK